MLKTIAVPFLFLIIVLHYGNAADELNTLECWPAANESCDARATCKVFSDETFKCVCPEDAIGGDGFKGENHTGCIFKNEEISCSKNSTCLVELGFCSEAKNVCVCIQGYKGNGVTECVDIDECASDAMNLCNINANCTNNNGSYSCSCHQGYNGDGFTCEKTCSVEATLTCDPNATCKVLSDGSFKCVCPRDAVDGDGLKGENSTGCIFEHRNVSCEENATVCHDALGFCNDAKLCQCKEGYKGNGETECVDIDECASGAMNLCDVNAKCTNHPGFYNCSCNQGYKGDGFTCEKIVFTCSAEANQTCDPNATCKFLSDGSFKCVCPRDAVDGDGLKGENSTGCIFEHRNVSCEANATVCHDALGFCNDAKLCQCKEGYKGNGETECVDIDECASDALHLCDVHANCTNTPGSYNCSCNQDYDGDGFICKKEGLTCSFHAHHTCHPRARCEDLPDGSIRCICPEGTISGDGFRGENHTGCILENERISCLENSTCHKELGFCSEAKFCECMQGYKGDGVSECVDINECLSEALNLCDVNARCINIPGAYNCSCNEDYMGDGFICNKTCVDDRSCTNNSFCNFYTRQCECHPGFRQNETLCLDINECEEVHDCHEKANCTNLIGSYNCTCHPGLNGNGVNCTETPADCQEILNKDNSSVTGYYTIDPDNVGPIEAIEVYCIMRGDLGITVIETSFHQDVVVGTFNVTYNVEVEVIKKIVEISAFCYQTMSYTCNSRHSMFDGLFYWTDGNGEKQYSWAGGDEDYKCSCGTIGMCYDPTKGCNCENNDLREIDKGKIINKTLLPIQSFTRIAQPKSFAQISFGNIRCSSTEFDIPKNCHQMKFEEHESLNITAYIDTDGAQGPFPPTLVYCDMTSEDHVGITIVPNNWITITEVVTVDFSITYHMQQEMILSLINSSAFCMQDMSYICKNSPLMLDNKTTWTGGQGDVNSYWPGAMGVDGKCGCGILKSCDNVEANCNCDILDGKEREDFGVIIDKNKLPITSLSLISKRENGNAKFRLGGLKCSQYQFGIKPSCNDYRNRGSQKSYTYLIDVDDYTGPLQPFPVFCLMVVKPPYGSTIVHHHLINITSTIEFTYVYASITQVTTLIANSAYCSQSFKYHCSQAPLTSGNKIYGPNSRLLDDLSCDCKSSGDCSNNEKCNCDANLVNVSDSVTITTSSQLPITKIEMNKLSGTKHAEFEVEPLICLNILKSCFDIMYKFHIYGNNPLTRQHYTIDPDGYGNHPPFMVFCNFIVTEVPNYVTVQEGEGTTCFGVKYQNDVTPEQVTALVKYSRYCTQYINYQCYQNPGTDHIYYETCDGETYYDMTGLASESMCGCGLRGSCKGGLSHKCNCDSETQEWLSDSSYIHNKSRLAVCKVCVKKKSYSNVNIQQRVNVNVFTLYCSKQPLSHQSTCQDQRNRRTSNSGEFFVLSQKTKIQVPVYCEMIYNPPTGILVVYPRDPIIDIFVNGTDIEIPYFMIDIELIIETITNAVYCTQELTIFCNSSTLVLNNEFGWYSRDGVLQNYWPSERGGIGCQGNNCNCRIENGENQTDSGIITNKDLLPITRIKLGPSEGSRKILIGPLKCYNVYRDCQEIREHHMHKNPLGNNVYSIDPDGAGGENFFAATCNFTDRFVAVTEVTHVITDFTEVTFSTGKNITLNYTLSTVHQIKALVNYSKFCHQDVEYRCKNTPLINNGSDSFGYLVSYEGAKMDRFGIGYSDDVGCSCMVTGTCPANHTCECDAVSSNWKWDGGVVVNKAYLPLTKAIFLPTTKASQKAKISISSLKCSSKPIYFPINCVDAYNRGMKTGSIFIQPSDKVEPFFVYCDMELISKTGVTIIRNEFEITTTITTKRTQVIYYNVTYVQIEALIKSHSYCYQPVKFNCRYTKFMGNGAAFWNGNAGSKQTYFGNTGSKENMCTCGAERRCGGAGNRNTILSRLCNCDSYDSEWKADAGVISIKDDLPVRVLVASRYGATESKLTIGKLYCADKEIYLNECEMGFHDCHVNATCLNTKKGFNCYCNEGYQGRGTGLVANGRTCPDDNECRLSMCPWSAVCYNLPGTFQCVCYSGFRQTGPTTCEDIDECAEGTHRCDKNAQCFNTIGSYFCRCNRDFVGDGKVGDCRKIGICECFGDPHCISFDKKWLHFQGMCKYTLIRDNCLNLNSTPNFHIQATFWNKDIVGQENSWVKEITVFINDLRIDLLQKKVVRINGVNTKLPFRAADKVLIRPAQTKVELFADFGLQVSWDGYAFVKVQLEEKFANSTCGICGNFNGIEEDDWQTGRGCSDEGKITTDAKIFGQSWVVEDSLEELNGSSCSKKCENSTEPPICTEDKKSLATQFCDELHKEFQECFDLMEKEVSDQFRFSCLYDLCFMENHIIEALCQYMNALIVECQENIKVKSVTLHEYCRKECGPNQEWRICGKLTEVKSCFENNENQLTNSKEQCSEGCFCKEGFVRQENECILPSDCGCVYENVYYAIGDQIVIDNCGKKAFCEVNGTIEFAEYACDKNASCGIKDGVYDCFCNDGFFGNGTQCYEDFCLKEHNCTAPAECVSVQGGFYCQCPDGYNTNCDSCEDIDECLTNTHDCDTVGGCINNNGSYQCTCPKGYYMDKNKCNDLDECEMKIDNCANHSRCINTPGSFVCKCCSGYEAVGDNECAATGSITPEEQATCCICHGYLCGIEGEICGTDGKSYENWADLIIKACEEKTTIKMDYHHQCKKTCNQVKCPKYQMCVIDEATGNPKCVCEPCTEVEIIKKPVCSPAKVIFESFCAFKKFQCVYDIEQVVVEASQCKAIGDDAVSEWSDWSGCSVTCGEGTKTRTREPLRTLNVFEEASLPLTATSACYLDPCNGSVCFDFRCSFKAQICTDENETPNCTCPNCTDVGTNPVCAHLYVGKYAFSEETFINPCEARAAACENGQDFEIVKDMECDVLPVNCTLIPNLVNVVEDGCSSETKINVGKCSGGCGLNTGHCCNALAVEETKVNLLCPGGNSTIHTVKTVKRCDCVKRIFTSV